MRIRWLVAILLAGLVVGRVSAHGCGKVVIASESIDGYVVTVCHFPYPAETGTNHITVALADEAAEQPVLNRPITITATDGRQTLRHPATHDNATNRLLYEADFAIREAGVWDFAIEIEGVARPLTFTAAIAQASFFSAERIAAVIAVLVVGIIWRFFGRTR